MKTTLLPSNRLLPVIGALAATCGRYLALPRKDRSPARADVSDAMSRIS